VGLEVKAETQGPWFCYMLECGDESLYVGIATDIPEKVKRHNWGVGPEFTARRRPVKLIWNELCGSADAARKREKEIKGWGREKKLSLLKKAASEVEKVQR
jgi:putative endonuclease